MKREMNLKMENRKRYVTKPVKKSAKKSTIHFKAILVAVLFILVLSLWIGSFFSSAHENLSDKSIPHKYYKSVKIEEGESLWSIAEKYKGTKYDSVKEYMDELISLNQLTSDQADYLQEGDYLTIIYFDTE